MATGSPDKLDRTLLLVMVRPCWKHKNNTTLLSFEALDGNMLSVEWCGGVFHPRDQAVEQGECIFHH